MNLRYKILLFIYIISNNSFSAASTHWLLANGRIQPQLSSPFFLRNPDDLAAFLNQSVYKQKLDRIMEELIQIKKNLTLKMNELDLHTNDLTTKIGCIPNYYLDESDLYSTITKNYLYKVNYRNTNFPNGNQQVTEHKSKNPNVPKCHDALALDFSMFCFEHLTSMRNRDTLKMEPEESLGDKELSISSVTFPKFLATELKTKPNSWKLHTLASYYWRFKGNAPMAIECARRAIYLAPRKFKDIPLLSLGTILQRTKNVNDSIVVLNAAVDHAPNTPENQLALGNSLILLSDFNRSMSCYDIAKGLDRMHSEKVNYIKRSINCFRGLKIVLLTMERNLDQIIPGLERYGVLKKDFEEYHEKLDREQVPFSTRWFDEEFDEQQQFLIERSQICTTRYSKDSAEPMLVCDFISDIQMVMQDFAIDILNNYVDLKKELINTYKINSLGIYKKVFVENLQFDQTL